MEGGKRKAERGRRKFFSFLSFRIPISAFRIGGVTERLPRILCLLAVGILTAGSIERDTHYVAINFDDGYYAVYKYAYPILLREKIPFTLGIITKTLFQRRVGSSPYSYLTIEEIKEMMDSAGCEIASHSVSHTDLTKLDSLSLVREIFNSKRELESLFQREVKVFIYPYGRYNREIIRLLSESNYSLARSVDWGEVNFFSPYRLPVREVRRGTEPTLVLEHIAQNRFTILLFHRIVPHPKYFTDYAAEDFRTLISKLKSPSAQRPIRFLTLGEMSRKFWREALAKILLPANNRMCQGLFQKIDFNLLSTSYPR